MITGISNTSPTPKDERRHEGDVFARARRGLEHVAPEREQKVDGVGQQQEIAEGHPTDEEQEHERSQRQEEPPLVFPKRRIDVRVDLVQDDRHRQRDTGEERHPHVRRESFGRADDLERLPKVRRRLEQQDDVLREEERDTGRDDDPERRDHEPASELSEVLDEGELLVALRKILAHPARVESLSEQGFSPRPLPPP